MKHVKTVAAIALLVNAAMPAWAGEFATKDEAKAMVAKAVAYVQANGAEKAYAEFTGKSPAFIDRDLYVVVYGLNGELSPKVGDGLIF